jgi:urocanate hydratase
VLVDGQLAAVLTLLQDEMHSDKRGSWYLEAGLGDWAGQQGMIFATLGEAAEWLLQYSV